MIRGIFSPAARRKATPEFTWEDLATASLPVLACFLGGATEKWAEGIIVGLLGFLLLLNPPRFSLGPVMHGILLALIVCAAFAFLPAQWFFQPAWRAALIDDLGIKLAPTLSPQPWISLGCLLSLGAGLCWLYYVCGQEVEVRAARRQLRIFVIGVILLAALAVILYGARAAVPFWHNERGFGPFPNRNQTASLLGITAILIVACAHDEIRRHKKKWIFWLLGLAIVGVAIVLNFSRAGLVLLVAGCALWLGILILRSGSALRIALGISTLLLVLAALLVFGGETLERFHLREAGGGILSGDFRWLIFKDAFALIKASPWPGVGLGNFEPVFAIFRDASSGQNRALHPESDWLWLWAEIGWPGVVLALIGAAILIRRCFPFVEGTNQWFRIAALLAALLFALHACIDVGGHRVGTAYAGIFLLGMSLRRPGPRAASVALINFFRLLGFVLVLIGAIWVVAPYRALPLPGSLGVDAEKHLAKTANVGRNFNETIRHATRGLEWAPLDWQLYFLRALGSVSTNRSAEALDDFRRARFLEPNSIEVPYQEGVAWVARDPVLAVTAWREALHRASEERPEVYGRMLAVSVTQPLVRQMLQEQGEGQADLALILMEQASGEKFNGLVERFLQHDPTLRALTRKQHARFFGLWIERGDLAQLTALLEKQPEWMNLAWRGPARWRANKGEFRRAMELAQRFGDKPTLPTPTADVSLEQLQRDAYSSANNFAAGFALFQLQMQQNKIDDALVTVRRFSSRPGAPGYFNFLESEAWAAKGEWERAWNARKKFDESTR